MKSLPPKDYCVLPKLDAPAGYICVLRDIDRDAYRIDSTDHPATYVDALLAELTGTYGIELISILETDDLNAAKSELYDHYGVTLGDVWHELDPYQLQELRGSRLQINAHESCYLTAREAISHSYMEAHEWEALPRLDPPAGYVYLLHSAEVSGRYKIGHTNNLKRRMKELRTGISVEHNLVHFIVTDDSAGLEREFHQRYKMDRKHREWFDLSPAQVEEICNWDTGLLTPPDYGTPSNYPGHSQSIFQYAQQEELLDLYETETWQSAEPSDYALAPYYPRHSQSDYQHVQQQELPELYEVGTRQNGEANKSARKLTWKKGCLYLFFLLFAASLMPRTDHNSTSRRSSSSARRNESVVRTPVTTTNRTSAATSTATSYVKTSDNFPANVRACPRTTSQCAVIGRLLPGEAVRQLERVAGEKIGGSNKWIKFRHDGKIAYIHSSVLSASRVSTPIYHVATNNNASASVRSCPRRTGDCKVIGGLLPGVAIRPQEAVTGELVNGNPVWIKFRHDGKTAYIHSSLVTASR